MASWLALIMGFTGGLVCSNGIPGVESSNGIACCPPECGECEIDCGSSRRLSEDNSGGSKRRLTLTNSGDSSDSSELTDSLCGIYRRRRLTYSRDSSSDSEDSGHSDVYCDCGSSRRSLTWGQSSDSKDSCDCGLGRRLTSDSHDSNGSSDSDDDCNCECECECEPDPTPEPEFECCATTIANTGEKCDVVGTAPCALGEFLLPWLLCLLRTHDR